MKRLIRVSLGIVTALACLVLLLYHRTTRTDSYIPQGYRGWLCLVYNGEARWWYLPKNNNHYFSSNGLAYAGWLKNSVWTQNYFWIQGPKGVETLSQQPTSPDQVGVWGAEVLTFQGDPQLNGRVAEMFFVGTRKDFKTAMDKVTTDPKALPDLQFLESRRELIVQRRP